MDNMFQLAVRQRGVFVCGETHSVPSSHASPAGLSVDGLYRVSGNLAVIQKLRFAVNHGRTPVCLLTTNVPKHQLSHIGQLTFVGHVLNSQHARLWHPLFSITPPHSFHQMRSWIWMTASGRTSTSPLEPWRCSSGSFLSLSSHMAPSTTLLTPSVSNSIHTPCHQAFGVQHLCP